MGGATLAVAAACQAQTLYSCDTLLTGMYPTLPLLTCVKVETR